MLQKIQSELKAPKGQYNSFGKYKYRNCEDILEAVKPILATHGMVLTLSDEVKSVDNVPQMNITDEKTKPKTKTLSLGTLVYIEATATITKNGELVAQARGQAGIDINKAGMDVAQCFGSSSSYARKYALNGLFCIDDTKDLDATNKHGKGTDDDSISEDQFNNLFPKWEKIVKDGKQTHKQLLSFIEKKGLKLAPGHIDLINKMEVTAK